MSIIREAIVLRMRRSHITQREISKALGIDYSTLNTFLSGKKSMWFWRVQSIFDYLGLSAEGDFSGNVQSLREAIWLEMRYKKLHITDLATALGISYGALNTFLNGNGGISTKRVERIIEYLGLRIIPNGDDRHRENRTDRKYLQGRAEA